MKNFLIKIYTRIIACFLFKKIIPKNDVFFSEMQRLGYHIRPVHYYELIPDTRTLNNKIWEDSFVTNINFNTEFQKDLLKQFIFNFKKEYDLFPKEKTNNPTDYFLNCGSFISVDAEILYSMVRHFKPGKIFEIGSGFSTLVANMAIQKNKEDDSGYQCNFIAFEPYPLDFLKQGIKNLSGLVESKIEDIPVEKFRELGSNDILFIDSSHVLKAGSDVYYEFFKIIPTLQKGVIIHFHDIFLPFEYPREWMFKHKRFWNEQYILLSFLMFNDYFEVIWAGNYLRSNYPEMLKNAFSSFTEKTVPGSFWIRKIR